MTIRNDTRVRLIAITTSTLVIVGSFTAWASTLTPALTHSTSSTTTAFDVDDEPTSESQQVVLDSQAGGSPEVVYPDPSESEQLDEARPDAPSGLRVSSITDTSVTIDFDADPEVSSYSAYIRYGDSFTLLGLGTDGTATFTGLTPDWDYTVCVFYRVDEIESNRACIEVHTTGSRETEPESPDAPNNLELSATESTLTASWSPVAGAVSYRVCHVNGDMSWQCGGYRHLTATSVIFDDGSIQPATQYGVTVVAVGADGRESEATRRFITTPGTPPPPPTKYAAPTNLRIVEISTTSVTIAWDYPADSPITVWGFTIRRLTSYSSVGVSGSARSYTYTGLTPGLGYELILEGRDASSKYTDASRLGFYAPSE